MKLSDREIEVISNIPKYRRDRKLGASQVRMSLDVSW